MIRFSPYPIFTNDDDVVVDDVVVDDDVVDNVDGRDVKEDEIVQLPNELP